MIPTFNLAPFPSSDFNVRDIWSLTYLIYGEDTVADLLVAGENGVLDSVSIFDTSRRALFTLTDSKLNFFVFFLFCRLSKYVYIY